MITCAASDAELRAETAKVADMIVAGDEAVDLAAAIGALRDRGLSRVLCEGGPHLFGDLSAAGLVDELCLSLSPMLAGPAPPGYRRHHVRRPPACPHPGPRRGRRLPLLPLLRRGRANPKNGKSSTQNGCVCHLRRRVSRHD